MDNQPIQTEYEALKLIDEAAFVFAKALKEEKTRIMSESIIREQAGDVDLDDPAFGDLVAPKDFTFRQFLNALKNPKNKTRVHVADHLSIEPKTVQRINRWIRENKPEWLEGIGGGGDVYTGSGRGGRSSIKDVELFSGEIYQHQTRIPPRRWRFWQLFTKTSVRQRVAKPFFRRWEKIFLFGFQFEDQPDIFYELWFDTATSTYEIHDRYGDQIRDNYQRLNDAVNAFVDLVGSFGDAGQLNIGREEEQEIEDELKKGAKDNMRDAAKNADREERGRGLFGEAAESTSQLIKLTEEQIAEAEELRRVFLERTINTRSMFAQMINSDLVEEYHVSRMTRHLARSKFTEVFGRKPEMPNKFLGGGLRNRVAKIFGNGREATFVVGLSLANQVDVEIWFIKTDRDSGTDDRASYWVFDMTSGRVVGKGIDRPRDAYALAARKVVART